MEYNQTAEVAFLIADDGTEHCPAPLAMAYVPVQQWTCVYEDDHKALCRGTIFPCLDKPFLEGMCPHV